jgi:branched-chain amino acid transport system permease protein
MEETTSFDLRSASRLGLLAGIIALCVSIIGMVATFAQRDMISGLLTLGHLFLFAAPFAIGYITANNATDIKYPRIFSMAFITGVISAIPLLILLIVTEYFNLRQFLINVSPDLRSLLTFDQSLGVGSLLLVTAFSLFSLVGAGTFLLPERIRRPIILGLVWTLMLGLLSENLVERIRSFFGAGLVNLMFISKALRPTTAGLIFLLIAGGSAWAASPRNQLSDRAAAFTQQPRFRQISIVLVILFLVLLPALLGTYLSEVLDNVGIFVLMGLGLNIVVGFAGLLDLGYVAFFAIGAYTMAVLTSTGDLGMGLSFWVAIPICIAVSVLAGIILGVPVLRMRGDYLAIVTLGFGEIIRILALSDVLKPYIGGAQGVLKIPKPQIGDFALIKPEYIYYIILAGCLIAAFVSWRLREARLGRQWMAMREDEDVAEAMGINLVSTKLLAFGIGAAFSGLAGAIFASKLSSIFPHSFSLLISINVLCLIIVGGIGSLPGVVVGSLILVGLPELLREFKEYRLLMYGALLIVMMLVRPEGFIPSAVQKRELHVGDNQFESAEAAAIETGD